MRSGHCDFLLNEKCIYHFVSPGGVHMFGVERDLQVCSRCLQVCRVQAIAAPVREETGSVPNATQFTQDLIAEEKK